VLKTAASPAASAVCCAQAGPVATRLAVRRGVNVVHSNQTWWRRNAEDPVAVVEWQCQLNPHHNNSGDMNESRLLMEPLAAFDPNGDVIPR
jgi:hypothetical protein